MWTGQLSCWTWAICNRYCDCALKSHVGNLFVHCVVWNFFCVLPINEKRSLFRVALRGFLAEIVQLERSLGHRVLCQSTLEEVCLSVGVAAAADSCVCLYKTTVCNNECQPCLLVVHWLILFLGKTQKRDSLAYIADVVTLYELFSEGVLLWPHTLHHTKYCGATDRPVQPVGSWSAE